MAATRLHLRMTQPFNAWSPLKELSAADFFKYV